MLSTRWGTARGKGEQLAPTHRARVTAGRRQRRRRRQGVGYLMSAIALPSQPGLDSPCALAEHVHPTSMSTNMQGEDKGAAVGGPACAVARCRAQHSAAASLSATEPSATVCLHELKACPSMALGCHVWHRGGRVEGSCPAGVGGVGVRTRAGSGSDWPDAPILLHSGCMAQAIPHTLSPTQPQPLIIHTTHKPTGIVGVGWNTCIEGRPGL